MDQVMDQVMMTGASGRCGPSLMRHQSMMHTSAQPSNRRPPRALARRQPEPLSCPSHHTAPAHPQPFMGIDLGGGVLPAFPKSPATQARDITSRRPHTARQGAAALEHMHRLQHGHSSKQINASICNWQ